jgi:hypothetical protein
MNKTFVLGVSVLLAGAAVPIGAARLDSTWIVTSSNAPGNALLVYDTTGALVQAVSTGGQGGVGGNAGGIAAHNGTLAVVNFGSQSVAIFGRANDGFELRQLVPTVSAPVSVAFGGDHLYVLGTTTVESHQLHGSAIDPSADGVVALLRADASAAQVGVAANQLVISEKSGAIEVADLQGGAVLGSVVPVEIPPGSDTPFGLVARGSKAYVTIAHSDEIGLVEKGRLVALAATGSGFPDGPGQQAPCWIALVGPYLFTSNSPSHTISRLLATSHGIVLDEPVVARTNGAPIDIAAGGGRLAVLEDDGNGQSHLTQFRLEPDGTLVPAATTGIASAANGVAIVAGP